MNEKMYSLLVVFATVGVFCQTASAAPAGSVEIEYFRNAAAELYNVEGNINSFVDKLVPYLRSFMMNNHLDPLPVPDLIYDFWFEFLFINNTGTLQLDRGWIQDMSTLGRDTEKDCFLRKEGQEITVFLELRVPSLLAYFDYVAKFLSVGPTGTVEAKLKETVLSVKVVVNIECPRITLVDLVLTNKGDIDLSMTGLTFLGDALANVFLGSVIDLFKGTIMNVVGDQMKSIIQNALNVTLPCLPPPPSSTSSTTSTTTTTTEAPSTTEKTSTTEAATTEKTSTTEAPTPAPTTPKTSTTEAPTPAPTTPKTSPTEAPTPAPTTPKTSPTEAPTPAPTTPKTSPTEVPTPAPTTPKTSTTDAPTTL